MHIHSIHAYTTDYYIQATMQFLQYQLISIHKQHIFSHRCTLCHHTWRHYRWTLRHVHIHPYKTQINSPSENPYSQPGPCKQSFINLHTHVHTHRCIHSKYVYRQMLTCIQALMHAQVELSWVLIIVQQIDQICMILGRNTVLSCSLFIILIWSLNINLCLP